MNTYLVSSIGCVLLLVMTGCASPKSRPPAITPDISGPNPNYNNQLEKANADSFFDKKRIFETTPIHPLRMAGAIAWTDKLPDGQYRWGFTRLQPKVDMPKAELQNEIVFSSIVDKNFSAGVSYLAFVTASLSGEDKAEVYVEKIFRALGPEFNQEEVMAPIREFMKKNRKPGREFYYVEAMQYNTLKLKRLKKVSGKVKASYFVGIDGAAYSSDERFMVKELVAVEMIALDEFRGGLREVGPVVRPERVPPPIKDFDEKWDASSPD